MSKKEGARAFMMLVTKEHAIKIHGLKDTKDWPLRHIEHHSLNQPDHDHYQSDLRYSLERVKV